MTWLIDTLLSTGALIALVLLLRRPVSRLFGPGLAYALWALPLLRLILPPLVLPAEPVPVTLVAPPLADLPLAATPAGTAEAGGIDWLVLLQAVWLAGALAYLVWRVWQYRAMRRALLRDAVEVGRAGTVRLVEGPAIASPVAFGLRDKVVALPQGFLDRDDRRGRDLAIAHELEHHAGRDLAVNLAVQPLLALHWFNPVAWLGWRALRRDQEAACDARVLAGASSATREAYGRLIAAFACKGQPALATPLACPVIGEKSVIHRLRSLTMIEPSPRRRLAGRGLIAAAVLALPLTATISYAASDAASPAAPSAEKADKAEKKIVRKVMIIDHKDGADPADPALKTRVVERDGKTIVIKTAKDLSDAELEASIAKAEASMAEVDAGLAKDGARVLMVRADGDHSAPGEKRKEIRIIRHGGDEHHALADDHGVIVACKDGQPTEIAEQASKDGKTQAVRIKICDTGVDRAKARQHALAALKEARDNLGKDENLSTEMRQKIIDRLDAKITELSKQG